MAEIVLVLDSQLQEIAALADRVDEFCDSHDLPPQFAFQFNICFEEVLTNIIQHGLGGRAGRAITVRVALEGPLVMGEVVDDAPAFDPLALDDPDIDAELDEREIGGLGIHLLRRMMDEVSYARIDGHNRLRFSKRLPD